MKKEEQHADLICYCEKEEQRVAMIEANRKDSASVVQALASLEEKIKDNELVEDDIMTMLYGARDVKETFYEVNAFG